MDAKNKFKSTQDKIEERAKLSVKLTDSLIIQSCFPTVFNDGKSVKIQPFVDKRAEGFYQSVGVKIIKGDEIFTELIGKDIPDEIQELKHVKKAISDAWIHFKKFFPYRGQLKSDFDLEVAK